MLGGQMEASMRRIGPACALLMVIIVVPSSVLGQKPPELTANSVERGFADVPGGRLYYEIAGSGDPVVLIHGGWGDIRYWDEQFVTLSQNYRVLRYDVRLRQVIDASCGFAVQRPRRSCEPVGSSSDSKRACGWFLDGIAYRGRRCH